MALDLHQNFSSAQYLENKWTDFHQILNMHSYWQDIGAQWLSGRVLDSRPKGRGLEPHRRRCVVVLEQDTFILAKYWFIPGRPVPI